MLHRLCGPPSIPLSFNLAAVLPRRDAYRVTLGAEGVDTPDTEHPSFTARTTRVSNPVRSPRFRVSASVQAQSAAFAMGVLPDLYAFHRYTRNSTLLCLPPDEQSPRHCMGLSPNLSPQAYPPAYTRFTPNKFGQRSPPPYYRGCWHGVSRGLFVRYRPCSSLTKGVYNPKAVFLHATSLRQGCPHCARFLIAAPRRSLGRVSVPIRLTILSDQLPVVALVSRYLTNQLIGRNPLLAR